MNITAKAKQLVTKENVKKAASWIGKTFLGILFVSCAREMGVDARIGNYGGGKSRGFSSFDPMAIPPMFTLDKVQDRAIWSIYRSTLDMDWDSNKYSAASDIARKALESNDPDTSILAIDLLERISSDMDWDSNKSKVTALISKIGDKSDKGGAAE